MRRAAIYLRGIYAGELTECSINKYIFRYDDNFYYDTTKQDISLTLSKKQQEYKSSALFPFFANLLSEGNYRTTQAKLLGIKENDDFGLLLATAQYDIFGAITVKPIV